MSDYTQPDSLNGITLIEAHVKNDQCFAFVGQRYINTDAWHDSLTYVVFYHADRPKEKRWTVHELDYKTDAGSVTGTWCNKPEPLWLFGYQNTGYMLAFNEAGESIGQYQRPDKNYLGHKLIPGFLSPLRSVKSGEAYVATGLRMVHKMEHFNQWQLLDNGIPKLDYWGEHKNQDWEHGFSDIAGFADDDLYACGGDGDLWHYNGIQWLQKELPTNATLRRICCGGDGRVYISTNMKTVVVGRDNRWKVIEQTICWSTFKQIVWYRDRCLINTEQGLYEINHDVFIKSALTDGIYNLPTCIAVQGNILLAVSKYCSEQNEICYYDGEKWNKVLYRERPPKDPNAPTLAELIEAYQKKYSK